MRKPSVLAFGEVLWDVVQDKEYIGGAPFNFAAHAAQCGLEASLYSRVGNDQRGRKSLVALERFGVESQWMQIDEAHPTGWVEVVLNDGQPSYTITANVAWDHIAPPAADGGDTLRAAHFDALYFGTLAQRDNRSREALRALRKILRDVPVFYDVNLRPPCTPMELAMESLPGAAIVKLNEEEAGVVSAHLWKECLKGDALFARLVERFDTRILLLTRGSEGCQVVTAEGCQEVAGEPVKVASAVGAGDAFSAAFLSHYLLGLAPFAAAKKANAFGAWVASCAETVPQKPYSMQN